MRELEPGSRQCQGSDTRMTPVLPTTSRLERSGTWKPQSKWASTPPANDNVPAIRTSTPLGPTSCWAVTVSGSPASSRDALTQ